MPIDNLPTDFPTVVHATIEKEFHRERFQLFASYSHGGKKYKLIPIANPHRLPVHAHEGEKWAFTPQRSPNGHIVFCYPLKQVTAEYLANPILAAAHEARRQRSGVSISCYSGMTRKWQREGVLMDAVLLDNGELRLTLSKCKLSEASAVTQRSVADYFFEFEVDGDVNYVAMGLSCHVKRGSESYSIQFHARNQDCY